MTVKALVLAGFGLNCDLETAHALNLAGAEAERVHISQLTGTGRQAASARLEDYRILVFDGGVLLGATTTGPGCCWPPACAPIWAASSGNSCRAAAWCWASATGSRPW